MGNIHHSYCSMSSTEIYSTTRSFTNHFDLLSMLILLNIILDNERFRPVVNIYSIFRHFIITSIFGSHSLYQNFVSYLHLYLKKKTEANTTPWIKINLKPLHKPPTSPVSWEELSVKWVHAIYSAMCLGKPFHCDVLPLSCQECFLHLTYSCTVQYCTACELKVGWKGERQWLGIKAELQNCGGDGWKEGMKRLFL